MENSINEMNSIYNVYVLTSKLRQLIAIIQAPQMTIITRRLVVRATKISKKDEIKEAQKLYPIVLEACPQNQQIKKRSEALQEI